MIPFENIPSISGEFKDAAEHNPAQEKRVGKTPPFSLRLTAEEKAALKREAGAMPLGAFIRTKLLGKGANPRRRSPAPLKDDRALAQVLAELGKARLANNLNQLAKAANSGSLAITPETDKALQQACRDVAWMRERLVASLGLRPELP